MKNMKNDIFTIGPWFDVAREGNPKRMGVYEGMKTTSLFKKTANNKDLFNWNGYEWLSLQTDSAGEPVIEKEITHWRGVIPHKNYPFNLVQPPPAKPSLLIAKDPVKHPDWNYFHDNYGLAASIKLVLSELIEYVKELQEYTSHFDISDDVDDSLNDLLAALEDENSDELLPPEDELKEPIDEVQRRHEERDYVRGFFASVDGLFELTNLIELFEDEDDEADPATQAASANIMRSTTNIRDLLTTALEG